MKIELRREEHDGLKVVRLCCGGAFACQMSERDMQRADWKNASEAEHACLDELQKWLDETPPKPEQVTTQELETWPLSRKEEIEMVEKRTREIVAWEQEHGE